MASSDVVARSCVWGIFSVVYTRTRRSVNSLQIGGVHPLNEGIVNLRIASSNINTLPFGGNKAN